MLDARVRPRALAAAGLVLAGLASGLEARPDPGAASKEDDARRELVTALAAPGPPPAQAAELARELVRLERDGSGPLEGRIARLERERAAAPVESSRALLRVALDLSLAAVLARESPPAPLRRAPEDEPLGLAPGAGSPWDGPLELLCEVEALDPTPGRALAADARARRGEIAALRGETPPPSELGWEPLELVLPGREPRARLRVGGVSGEIAVGARPFDAPRALAEWVARLREGASLEDPFESLELPPGGEITLLATSVAPGRETLDVPISPELARSSGLLLEARARSGPKARAVVLPRPLALLASPTTEGELAVAVLDFASGEPVPAIVELDELAQEVRGGGTRAFARSSGAPTDASGIARLPRDERFPRAVLRARTGDGRAAWIALGETPAAPARGTTIVHASWERALARPGETVRARLAVREASPERRGRGVAPERPTPGERLEVALDDGGGTRELLARDLPLDAAGATVLEIPLPADARGDLRLRARFRGEEASVEVEPCRVGEPRAGELRVTIEAPRLSGPGSPVPARLVVRDGRGAPLAGAKVHARLVSEGGELLGAETIATDDSGVATFAFAPGESSDGSARLEALAVDASGREGAASARVLFAASEPEVALSWERRFAAPGEEVAIDLDARALDGARRVSTRGKLELRLASARLVSESPVEAKEGRSRTAVKLPAPGVYEVAFIASDSPARASATVYGLGPGGALERPDSALELVAERPFCSPLETTRVLVRGRATSALVFARDATGRVRRGFPRPVALPQGAALVPIELDPSWIEGGSVDALALVDGRLARARATFVVRAPLERPLVEVTLERRVWKPGEKATVRVHVEARDMLPLRRAQIALSLEDDEIAAAAERARGASRSVPPTLPLASSLVPDSSPSRATARTSGAALVIGRPPSERESLDLTLEGPLPQATPPAGFVLVETDENGDAQAALTLPNVAGRWRVHARAFPREGGPPCERELTVATRRPLSLELAAPGRLETGDAVALPLIVSNESESEAKVELELAATPGDALTLEGEAKHALAVPARGSARLLVPARAIRAARVRLDAKLTAPGEPETVGRALVVVEGPRLAPTGAALALVGSETAAVATETLVAPSGSSVLVRVATPAALLGDLAAELARPGESPAEGFAALLLARRALDARGEAWDAVAKRHSVSADDELAPGELGKGPRDPRRSPLFSRKRLDAFVQEGLALVRAGIVSPRADAELDPEARALERLVLAREAGAPVTSSDLASGAAHLEVLLARAESASPEARRALAPSRALARWALALAGRPVDLATVEPDAASVGSEGACLLALLRLHRTANTADAPAARERALALVGEGVRDLATASRVIELALALGDTARADVLAGEALVLALGASGPRAGTAELAAAVAELVRREKPRAEKGSVSVIVGAERLELPLASDDPLATDGAAIASVSSHTPEGVSVELTRHGRSALPVVVTSLSEPSADAAPGVAVSARVLHLERSATTGAGRRWLRASWLGGNPREGDLARLELTVVARRPVARLRLIVPLPPGLELISDAAPLPSGLSVERCAGRVELFAKDLAPGAHALVFAARALFAGKFQAAPCSAAIGGERVVVPALGFDLTIGGRE
jgi:hypothetical protein